MKADEIITYLITPILGLIALAFLVLLCVPIMLYKANEIEVEYKI
jgi:hypothetical protein